MKQLLLEMKLLSLELSLELSKDDRTRDSTKLIIQR
jgi:hypothetical protein